MTGHPPAAFCGASLVLTPRDRTWRVAGFADPSTGRAWTRHTQSQLGSISKQVAAACALILVDRGLLRLEDPVTRHLPAAPGAVTVQDLLTHTSGLRHWCDDPGYVPSVVLPTAERLRLLLAGWRPGSGAFRYSSPGYLVLSAVIAAAAGQPYHQLVRELVLEPLALTGTTLGAPADGPRTVGCRRGVPIEEWDLSSMPGTGDVWSTADDVATFTAALHAGALLPGAVHPLVHRLHVPVEDPGAGRVQVTGYAAGHFVGTVDGVPARIHPGDNPGFQALAVWLPGTSATAAVLTNDEAVDISAVAADALRAS